MNIINLINKNKVYATICNSETRSSFKNSQRNNITKIEIGPVQNKLRIPLFEAKITRIQ